MESIASAHHVLEEESPHRKTFEEKKERYKEDKSSLEMIPTISTSNFQLYRNG